jgi:hypothetical protein
MMKEKNLFFISNTNRTADAVANDDEMVHRMIDYWNMLVRKYDLRVEQYVIFLGDEKPTMKVKVDYPNMKFHYRLINFKELDAQLFLKSNVPEEMILAILGDFRNDKPSKIVYEVVKRIEQSEPQTLEKQKIFQQLLVLGRLRKLEPLRRTAQYSTSYGLNITIYQNRRRYTIYKRYRKRY